MAGNTNGETRMGTNGNCDGGARRLSIGVQDFEKLRREECLYVDKTAFVFELVHTVTPYFLSRPRRFGKSLFLSTLKAYWEGKKELFEGLDIIRLEEEAEEASHKRESDPEKQYQAWQPYPVFYFDFNKDDFSRESALETVLDIHLKAWERQYGVTQPEESLSARFQRLLERAVEQTGKRAVVLVDEYDKPLLETMANAELEEHNKAAFKGFFSTLKSYDGYLKFVFLTGVTKFSKVSIFSDLNQLSDLSLDSRYAAICGLTEAEIRDNFKPEIEAMAAKHKIDAEGCMIKLAQMYDGYHFREDTPGVYNPFSVLNALDKKQFDAFWFSTGTPTFLLKKLKEAEFDPKKFTDGSIYADEATLSDYRTENPDPVPLLFQSGYLTIKKYDAKYGSYELGYPNNEVKYGFLKSLAPMFLQDEKAEHPLDIRMFGRDIESGNTDGLRDRFTTLFARIPNPPEERVLENNFQNVVYIVFMLLGQFIHTEVHNARGRADAVVETDDYVYIFEFKRDATADEALQQIEEKGYALPYKADKRMLIKVGAAFDSKKRELSDWKAV